jgi:hypothetical protein
VMSFGVLTWQGVGSLVLQCSCCVGVLVDDDPRLYRACPWFSVVKHSVLLMCWFYVVIYGVLWCLCVLDVLLWEWSMIWETFFCGLELRKKRLFVFLDFWIFVMFGFLDSWIFVILGLLDCWILVFLDFWIVGFLDSWICWIRGFLDSCDFGKCWRFLESALESVWRG